MTDLDPKALEAARRAFTVEPERYPDERDMENAIRAYLSALWRPIAEHDGGSDPVIVSFVGALTRTGGRIAVWQPRRFYQGDDFGPGFICYFIGTPLAPMTHFQRVPEPLPAPPETPNAGTQEGRTHGG